MRSPAHRSTRGFFLAAIFGAAAMAACSLNTQPIPPGAQAVDGGSDFNPGTGGGSSDASASVDSGPTTGTPPQDADAGDSSTDAGEEDASDAATDAGDE